MDIDIPSNFERYLFELFGRNAGELRACMQQIATKKEYGFGDKSTEEAIAATVSRGDIVLGSPARPHIFATMSDLLRLPALAAG